MARKKLILKQSAFRYSLLSNRPVGAQVGHASPVVNRVGLRFNMEKERIDCDP